jgi:hypothetical protein
MKSGLRREKSNLSATRKKKSLQNAHHFNHSRSRSGLFANNLSGSSFGNPTEKNKKKSTKNPDT